MIRNLDEPAPAASPGKWPAVTVVICERRTGDRTVRALKAVTNLNYPCFEVLVIGSSAHTAQGLRNVDEHGAGRTLWVDGMDDGIGRARNRGLHIADGTVVAYIDTGVAVDPNWLRFLLAGFERATDIATVTGLTTPGQLSTKRDSIIDALEPSPALLEPEVLRMHDAADRSDVARLHAGIDGTCRNFAVNRAVTLRAGGWISGTLPKTSGHRR